MGVITFYRVARLSLHKAFRLYRVFDSTQAVEDSMQRCLGMRGGVDAYICIACLRQVVAFAPKVIIACLRQVVAFAPKVINAGFS